MTEPDIVADLLSYKHYVRVPDEKKVWTDAELIVLQRAAYERGFMTGHRHGKITAKTDERSLTQRIFKLFGI